MGRAGPLWESGSVVAKGGVVDLVDQDPEESGGFVVRVRLKLRIDLDDKCGGYSGEQTGLRPSLARVSQNFLITLTKISVVFKSSSYFFMNSLSYSSDSLR